MLPFINYNFLSKINKTLATNKTPNNKITKIDIELDISRLIVVDKNTHAKRMTSRGLKKGL